MGKPLYGERAFLLALLPSSSVLFGAAQGEVGLTRLARETSLHDASRGRLNIRALPLDAARGWPAGHKKQGISPAKALASQLASAPPP